MTNKNTIDRHHLLEIILWPNGDGTFRTILNSRERLKELGIYDDFKMTIPLTRAEHTRLHATGERNPMYGRTGELRGMYGKKHSAETKKKMSAAKKGKYVGEKNPMYGRTLSAEHKQKLAEGRIAYLARRKASNK